METAKIFDFKNGQEMNVRVLDGGKTVKLTKDGKVKGDMIISEDGGMFKFREIQ